MCVFLFHSMFINCVSQGMQCVLKADTAFSSNHTVSPRYLQFHLWLSSSQLLLHMCFPLLTDSVFLCLSSTSITCTMHVIVACFCCRSFFFFACVQLLSTACHIIDLLFLIISLCLMPLGCNAYKFIVHYILRNCNSSCFPADD